MDDKKVPEIRKPIEVRNYASFLPFEDGRELYKIITNDKGEEIGFEVKGLVTTFGETNFNGQKWDKKAYDKVISEYFESNELNIPIDLMHKRDIQHLAGVAKKFVKKSEGIELTAFIPKGVYFYNLIKVLLDNGVLQGFSNYGYISDWEWDRTNDEMIVKEFFLCSVSLVDIPSDVGGKFIENSTQFEGFEKYESKPETANTLSLYGIRQ